MAERTAATMTTSLSFFARIAALPEDKVDVLWMVAMPIESCDQSSGRRSQVSGRFKTAKNALLDS
jgi:hypothetical protein